MGAQNHQAGQARVAESLGKRGLLTRRCMRLEALGVVLLVMGAADGGQSAPEPTARETAREVWLARGLGVTGAERAISSLLRWAQQEPASGEAQVALARAHYWLGLQRKDVPLPDGRIQEAFERGVEHGQRAQALSPKDPGGYYWEAVNRAKVAEIKGIISSAGQLPTLKRLMGRVDQLDPKYFYGGTHRYVGAVITRTPEFLVRMQGQSLMDAERHFQAALKIEPQFAASKTFWAELKIKQGDKAGAIKLLQEVLGAPPASDPEVRAWNAHEIMLARKTLERLM